MRLTYVHHAIRLLQLREFYVRAVTPGSTSHAPISALQVLSSCLHPGKLGTVMFVYRKIIAAVNIETGDDGSKAHKVLETFHELLKMDKEQYEKQQRYYA